MQISPGLEAEQVPKAGEFHSPQTDRAGKAEGAQGPLVVQGQHQHGWGYPHPKLGAGNISLLPRSAGSLPLSGTENKFTSFHLFKLFTDTFFYFCQKEPTENPYKQCRKMKMSENMAQTPLGSTQ